MNKRTDKKVREDCKKNKTWELFYPDGTSSLMTYDPIKFEKDKIKKIQEKESKIKELHGLVVRGLVTGLSHTHRDGRIEDISFWRRRCDLFNVFSLAVMNILTDQNYEYNLKELKEIADIGYAFPKDSVAGEKNG